MIEHKAVQLSFPEQSEEYSATVCSGVAPCLRSRSHFSYKNKVVPRSVVNPDHLEPFNCKGLFTTTHAIKHRSSVKSVEKTWHEQLATVAHLFLKVNTWLRLPDRNSEPGSIGIGQVPGLRTFFRASFFNFFNKVVPRSVVNPDHLEPFNCIGLFTTTHAIKHRSSVKSVEKTWHEQLATVAHLFLKVNTWLRLPDRNSEPGSIGIGQVPGLRTLFMNNTYNQLTGGLA